MLPDEKWHKSAIEVMDLRVLTWLTGAWDPPDVNKRMGMRCAAAMGLLYEYPGSIRETLLSWWIDTLPNDLNLPCPPEDMPLVLNKTMLFSRYLATHLDKGRKDIFEDRFVEAQKMLIALLVMLAPSASIGKLSLSAKALEQFGETPEEALRLWDLLRDVTVHFQDHIDNQVQWNKLEPFFLSHYKGKSPYEPQASGGSSTNRGEWGRWSGN